MKILRWILAILTLLVLVAIVVSVVVAPDKQAAEESPNDESYGGLLQEIYALGYNDEDRGLTMLSVDSGTAVDALPEFKGRVIDYKEQAGTQVAIVLAGDRQEVVLKTDNSDRFETIISDYKTKRRINISHDGNMIYFSEYDQKSQLDESIPESWNIQSYSIDERKLELFAQGFNPQTVRTDTGEALFYTTDYGVSLQYLDEDNSMDYQLPGDASVSQASYITPDAKHVLVYNGVLDEYDVFALSIANPLLMDPLFTIATNQIQAVTNTDVFYTDFEDNVLVAHELKQEPRAKEVFVFTSGDDYSPFRIINK